MDAVVQVIMFQGVFVGAVDAGNVDDLLGKICPMDEKRQVIVFHRSNLDLPYSTSRATTDLPEIFTEVRFVGCGHEQDSFGAGGVQGMA